MENRKITFTPRKKRSRNFPRDEENVIQSMVEANWSVLTEKHSSAVTKKRKNNVWSDIAREVNAKGVAPRSLAEVKEKWTNMTRKAKKTYTDYRIQARKTGGGPPPPEPSQATRRIIDIMRDSDSFDGVPAGLETECYAGRAWYNDEGGSATALCLPEQPIYGNHTDDHNRLTTYIYGTEYQAVYTGAPFAPLNDDDVPCAVCERSLKTMMIMIPARNRCYPGWTQEYTGYLMAGLPHEASSDYICVDMDAEAVPGGQADENGHLLYLAESQCGSLACPPYHNYWELTCVVCSK